MKIKGKLLEDFGRVCRRFALPLVMTASPFVAAAQAPSQQDPAYLLSQLKDTKSSPERNLTRHQLTRYLDYCSEILALNAKIAALFAQNMEDPVILSAVNELELLSQGLSAKIWQKIMILDLAEDD